MPKDADGEGPELGGSTPASTEGDVVLRASRPRQTLLYAALAALTVIPAVWLMVTFEQPSMLSLVPVMCLIFFLRQWRLRSGTLTLNAEGLHVHTPQHRHSYPWDDLLEVSWVAAGSDSGVLVRPRGGPYAVPGPHAPVQVWHVPSHGADSHRRARQALASFCERHEVTFTADVIQASDTAPPGSTFRTPPRKRRRGDPDIRNS